MRKHKSNMQPNSAYIVIPQCLPKKCSFKWFRITYWLRVQCNLIREKNISPALSFDSGTKISTSSLYGPFWNSKRFAKSFCLLFISPSLFFFNVHSITTTPKASKPRSHLTKLRSAYINKYNRFQFGVHRVILDIALGVVLFSIFPLHIFVHLGLPAKD